MEEKLKRLDFLSNMLKRTDLTATQFARYKKEYDYLYSIINREKLFGSYVERGFTLDEAKELDKYYYLWRKSQQDGSPTEHSTFYHDKYVELLKKALINQQEREKERIRIEQEEKAKQQAALSKNNSGYLYVRTVKPNPVASSGINKNIVELPEKYKVGLSHVSNGVPLYTFPSEYSQELIGKAIATVYANNKELVSQPVPAYKDTQGSVATNSNYKDLPQKDLPQKEPIKEKTSNNTTTTHVKTNESQRKPNYHWNYIYPRREVVVYSVHPDAYPKILEELKKTKTQQTTNKKEFDGSYILSPIGLKNVPAGQSVNDSTFVYVGQDGQKTTLYRNYRDSNQITTKDVWADGFGDITRQGEMVSPQNGVYKFGYVIPKGANKVLVDKDLHVKPSLNVNGKVVLRLNNVAPLLGYYTGGVDVSKVSSDLDTYLISKGAKTNDRGLTKLQLEEISKKLSERYQGNKTPFEITDYDDYYSR